jgi:DNA replication protein DnaC
MTARPEPNHALAPQPGPPTALGPLLERVGLAHAAVVLPAWLDRAAAEELSYADFLAGLLEEEAAARASVATQRRLREAGLPYSASIEQFDFRFRPELKRQVILRYLDQTAVEQARSLTLIGPPGLGKTMLAVCIATKLVQLGYSARFTSAQALANQLGRLNTIVGRQRLLRPLLACDVLVLDELGYLPTVPAFGPALYELVAGRYERRPILITSNKSLTEWAAIVQDASLAAAIVDRLLHHGEVFYLKGPSYRLKGKTPDGESPLP